MGITVVSERMTELPFNTLPSLENTMSGHERRHQPARERKLSLEAKLAAYVLAGGAIVSTTADHAEAGIIYSGVRNLTLDSHFELELNINDTGPLAFPCPTPPRTRRPTLSTSARSAAAASPWL